MPAGAVKCERPKMNLCAREYASIEVEFSFAWGTHPDRLRGDRVVKELAQSPELSRSLLSTPIPQTSSILYYLSIFLYYDPISTTPSAVIVLPIPVRSELLYRIIVLLHRWMYMYECTCRCSVPPTDMIIEIIVETDRQ